MADITGVRAVTNAVLSPNIEIKIGSYTIGYIKTLSEQESRPVSPIYEIGTVGVVEQTPNQPAPIALSAEHVAVYGANFNNIIAKMVDADGALVGISPAAGLSLENTKTAVKQWLSKRFNASNMDQVFHLSDFPFGFEITMSEQSPIDVNKQFITTYLDCKITKSSRKITAAGDLLIVENMDISAKSKSCKEGVPITQDRIEVITR